MSVSFLVSSLSMHDTHHHHHHPTEFRSASTTTTSQDEEFNDSSLNQNNKNDLFNRKISSTTTTTTTTSLHHRQHYICPKCEIQIDKNQVTFEKFEQHIIKCDSSKLVCIFCLEVFDLKQEVDFNNHIQRHLKYVDIRHNISDDYTNDITPTTTTTTSNNMNISRRDSNNSGGGSCSTSSSSNLVSSSSLSSRSNSNNEISNTAEPSNITHQQHRQNSKTCLIIHNFEPKIRKRL
jgi:hypothetical protein